MSYKIKNITHDKIYDGHYKLDKYTYQYLNLNAEWERQQREVFDRGHGAVVLLYNLKKSTVMLVEQFRMPVYVNQKKDAFLLEACAGMLDQKDPETAILKEIEEETGYRLNRTAIKKVFEAYSSPGAVTEVLHYFVAPYDEEQQVSKGGGAQDETENIVVKEIAFAKAVQLLTHGAIKDAKTIILLQYAQMHLFNHKT